MIIHRFSPNTHQLPSALLSLIFLPVISICSMLAVVMLILQFLGGRLYLRRENLASCCHLSDFFQNNRIMYCLKAILSPGKRSMAFAEYGRNRLIVPVGKCLRDQTPGIFFLRIKFPAVQPSYAGNFPVNIIGMGGSIAGNPPSCLCPAGCPG